MKSLKFTFYFGLLLGFTFLATPAMGCHKGGSMGMASEDPLNSTLDYTSGSTMVSASTSGTSGCENWDFVQSNRAQYLELSWKPYLKTWLRDKENTLRPYQKCTVAKVNMSRHFNQCSMATTLIFSKT